MNRLSTAEIAEIRERVEKATVPWYAVPMNTGTAIRDAKHKCLATKVRDARTSDYHQVETMVNAPEWCRRLLSLVSSLEEENARLREALTPSAETKAAYAGTFEFSIPECDEHGNEDSREIAVPWTTVKDIMAEIRARAALSETQQ